MQWISQRQEQEALREAFEAARALYRRGPPWEAWRFLSPELREQLGEELRLRREDEAQHFLVVLKETRLESARQRAETLQQLHRRERENQSCAYCGKFFNRLSDGKLKKEPDWCDPRTQHCKAPHGDAFCLAKQERKKKTTQRKNHPKPQQEADVSEHH